MLYICNDLCHVQVVAENARDVQGLAEPDEI